MLTQRYLVDEVRRLVDITCEDCSHIRCDTHRRMLLGMSAHDNFWSTKVLHNIGKRRLAQLLAWGITPQSIAGWRRARARASFQVDATLSLGLVGSDATSLPVLADVAQR